MLIILRSSTDCNLRCKYCSTPRAGERADLDLASCDLLVRRLPAILSEQETVTWLWHGGEPTMLAPQLFSRMQSVLNRISEAGFAARVSMQTNGYAMDSAWLEAFREHDVHIGLSMDGPKFLHDKGRVAAAGEPTYERVLANFNKMRAYGLSVSLLCTLSAEHMGYEEEMFTWIKEMGAPVRLNPLFRLGRAKYGLSARDYFAFLKRFYEISLAHGSSIPIQPLQGMLQAVLGNEEISECSYSGKCGERIFAFGPGSNVSPCNRSKEIYGNLTQNTLLELWQGAAWSRRRNRLNEMASRCGQCAVWTKCHGGCPEIQGAELLESDCAAKREFFAWLETEGLDLLRDALVQRRNILRGKLRLLAMAKNDFDAAGRENANHV